MELHGIFLLHGSDVTQNRIFPAALLVENFSNFIKFWGSTSSRSGLIFEKSRLFHAQKDFSLLFKLNNVEMGRI